MPGSSTSSRAGAHALDQPLGLTVHSLPAPQEAALADEQRTRHGRRRMLAVLLVCIAPVVASYLAYYVVRPDTRRNFGQLVEPQRPLPAVTAQGEDGKPVPLSSLRGQWLLLSVAGGACDTACEKHLWLQRQLRESLGKEKARVDWVWLVSDTAPVRPALRQALQQATVLHVDGKVLEDWLPPEPGRGMGDHLYVVDPMGHLMMRFPPGQGTDNAARVRRDLERLLRASAGWDVAGRPSRP